MLRLRLIEFLVHAGCPVNETSRSGFYRIRSHVTPLGELIDYEAGAEAFSRLLDLGAVVRDEDLTTYSKISILKQIYPRQQEGFLLSDSVQLTFEKRADGTKYLSTAAQAAFARTDWTEISPGYQLFLLSLGWPEGLDALVSFFEDLSGSEKHGLLVQIIKNDLLYAARTLLEHNSPVSVQWLAMCKSDAMIDLITNAFIARRQRLQQLAEYSLPTLLQNQLGMRTGYLPDTNALTIFTEVKARTLSVDLSLDPMSNLGVYYHSTFQIDQMEVLYQAGFRDIDTPDYDGYPPVLIYDRWPDRPGTTVPVSQHNFYHFIAINIMRAVERELTLELFDHRPVMTQDVLSSLSHDYRSFVEHTLSQSCTDLCSCACSSAGCTPLIGAIKFSLGFWCMPFTVMIVIWKEVIELIQEVAGCGNEVLRLFTFNDLSLTHTCCRPTVGEYYEIEFTMFDEEDAAEIQDEESVLIEEYEVLVQDLQKEYQRLRIPLWEFLQTHWSDQVRRYLVDNDETLTSGLLCVLLGKKVSECD
ncbi:hypothetical protein BJY04DRAFT_201008 [Aspergillus karnatakaensis]|uniref:uncharacterized protein n=1 Tax=Aspergillus karnatakaensis TaxID=1810916 RepID=UPI003CCDA390